MNTFLITFGFFLAGIAAMAVGYIFQRKVVRGSWGGLGAVGIGKVGNCPWPCDARKTRKPTAAARAALLAAWEKDRIA
ncbi:(Na+)-NQR maturation NqrM [Vibrio cholerae]|uniref:(Na+)-NQR maturation NqrM n=1 Tax=Vibrio cholerae TaxID=666 RepID=UPI0039C96C3E